MKKVKKKHIAKMRKALMTMEGALHLIGEHIEIFSDKAQIADYASRVVDWADLTDFEGEGLFAHPKRKRPIWDEWNK